MEPTNQTDPPYGSHMVARAAVERWQSIVGALTPLLGERGISAIYRRTFHIAGRSHPCLLAVIDDVQIPVDFKKLQEVLSQQQVDVASSAADLSIETFHDLLNSLIGRSLTQRLLGSLWSPTFSGSPVQDKST